MTGDWFTHDLADAVAPLLPGFAVEIVAEIDSTNTELMRRARAGATAPVLLVAERQTAGRGRLGRPWESAQGDARSSQSSQASLSPSPLLSQPARDVSLTFSLGLPLAPKDWSGLSLAVGASVADSLDPDHSAALRLKWPNDLWMADDRKLGGILIETALPSTSTSTSTTTATAQRYLVIGIGLNIGPRDAKGLRTAPAWLREWRPDVTAPEALRDIVVPLVRDVLAFGTQGFAPFAERFAARDALRGREVELSDGTVGQCDGVGWGGELRVRTAAGMQSISSSEVSVRPRPAAV